MKAAFSFIVFLLLSASTALGQVPDISSVPTNFDYGSVFVTQSQDFAFAITNVGTADLTINATAIQGINADQFRIVGGGDGRILGPGAAVLISVRFEPTSLGIKNAALRITSDDPNENPFDVPITGTGVGQPDISVNPNTLSFGDVKVGSTRRLDLIVTNTGLADLTVTSATVTGVDAALFQVVPGLVPFTISIPPTISRDTIRVDFTPLSGGDKSAFLTVSSNDPDANENPLLIALTGRGVRPDISVDPTVFDYGDVAVGSNLTTSFTITNTETGSLVIQDVTIEGVDPGQFTITRGGGGAVVNPGNSRNVNVRFTPTSLGSKSGRISIQSDDPDENPFIIPLSGTGIGLPDISVNRTNVAFGNVPVEATAVREVIVTNRGLADLIVSTATFTGPNANQFGVQNNNLPFTLAPQERDTVRVTFSPTETGNKSAFLNLNSNDLDETPTQILLSGQGVRSDISVDRTSHDFGEVAVGTNEAITFTITNLGTGNLSIFGSEIQGNDVDQFLITGGFGSFTITPDNSRLITVRFTPTSLGGKTAVLSIESDDPDGSPLDIPLTGRGFGQPDISINRNVVSFSSVLVGTTSLQEVIIVNVGLADLEVTDASYVGTDAGLFATQIGNLPMILSPEERDTLRIAFTPLTGGNKSASVLLSSNDPDENPLEIALTGEGARLEPDISVNRTVVSFNNVRVGTTSTQEIIVVNTGQADLEVTDASYIGTDAGLFATQLGSLPMMLSPEERDTLRIDFTPLTGGNKSASVLLSSNDPDESPLEILLAGEAVRPELVIDITNHDYGSVAIGTSENFEFIISNTGTGNLVIEETLIMGEFDDQFQITAGGGTATIVSGDSRIISVDFTPTTRGTKSAVLRITSDDLSFPVLDVALMGIGSTMLIDVTDTATEGQDVSLLVTIPSGFQTDQADVFYRLAGEQTYRSADINLVGLTLQAVIPGSAATLSGIEYYVVASNNDDTITLPLENPQAEPLFLPVRISELAAPLEFFSWTYRMVSVPLQLDNPTVKSVLEDDFGTYNTRRWRLFRWKDGRYTEFPEFNDSFDPGKGFWLITNDGTPFDVENGQSIHPASSLTITLDPGWNQIGNPYAFPLPWPADQIDPGIEAPVWFDGVEFQPDITTLLPWEGYFVFNRGTSPVSIPLSIREATGLGKELSGRDLVTHSGNEDFTIQLSAVVPGTALRDTQNFIGYKPSADNGYDSFDFSEAPPVGDFIRLSIIEDDRRFAGNFKPFIDGGQHWDLQLDGTLSNRSVTIELNRIGEPPEGMDLFVLDLDLRSAVSIEQNAFSLDLPPTGEVRNLRFVLGTTQYAKNNSDSIPLVPVSYELEQNYPNPFNPETVIRYQVSEHGPVRLEIFDLLGRHVRTLVNDTRDTGAHEVRWDGRNDSGMPMASGLYIYRLRAGKFEFSRKMLLVR